MWSPDGHGNLEKQDIISLLEKLTGVKMLETVIDGLSSVKFNDNKIVDIIWCNSKPYLYWKGSWVYFPYSITTGKQDQYSDGFIDGFLDILKSRYEIKDVVLISKIMSLKDGITKEKEEGSKEKGGKFLGWLSDDHRKRLSMVGEGIEEVEIPEDDDQLVIIAEPQNKKDNGVSNR